MKYNNFTNRLFHTTQRLSLTAIALITVALLTLSTNAWGDASTTTDGKYATGTIDFSTIGNLSTNTTYWHNGIKFFSGNSQSPSAGTSTWSEKIDIPAYIENQKAGNKTTDTNKWGSGGTGKQYTMSGFACNQHTIGIHVNSACTITVVVNKNISSDTNDAGIAASIDGTAYNTAWTSSTYKVSGSALATAVTSTRADATNAPGRYTLTIIVKDDDLTDGEAVIKMYNSSSGTGAGKLFCWETITITTSGGGGSSYTVTYAANGGSGAAMENSTGASITLAANTYTAPTGYSFSGWNTATDGSGDSYSDEQSGITKNLDLYAQWTQTVTLDANTANHGSINGSATATFNRTALSGITHATGESGYILLGYFTAATDGTKVLNADGTFASSNITDYITSDKWSRTAGAPTLYAQWEYDPCLKWGYETTNTAKFSSNEITSGDLKIISIGGLGNTTTTPFDGSGSLNYVIGGGFTKAKYITGDLGGTKIETIKIGASTSASSGLAKEGMSIAFSSKIPFDPAYLLDYDTDVQVHIFQVAQTSSGKTIYTINAPKGAKSFALGRNFDIGSGCTFGEVSCDETVSSWTGNRYVYYLSVCPDDDCSPTITTQPAALTKVALNTSVTLTVATDEATPTYQWYKCDNTDGDNPVELTDETAASLTVNSPASAGKAYYYCVVSTGSTCNSQSDIATVESKTGCETVKGVATAKEGDASTYAATGDLSGTVQDYLSKDKKLDKNRYVFLILKDYLQAGDVVEFDIEKQSDMSGHENKLYIFLGDKDAPTYYATLDADAKGVYELILPGDFPANTHHGIGLYRNDTYNANPFINSVTVSREICYCTKPNIITHPANRTICEGETHTLSVTATGSSPTYQWYKDDVLITGAKSNTYTTPSNLAASADYYCIVTSFDGCPIKSNTARVTVNIPVTIDAAWATEPADAPAGAPNMTAAITTNYSAGLEWSSSDPSVVSINSSTGEMTYLKAGTAKITATVEGKDDDGYCGSATKSKKIEVTTPSCVDQFSFHWGTDGGSDWSQVCFEKQGDTHTWFSPLFTIPSPAAESDPNNKLKYFVGYMGSWNETEAKSTDGYFHTTMPYALSPSQSKLLSAARSGNVGGAQGYLRIYDDSGDANRYVGFIPAGYAVRFTYKDNTKEFIPLIAASADKAEIAWASDIVTLTADMLDADAHYDVELKTEDSYVWAEGRSLWTVPVDNMRVRDVNDSWRATALSAGDAGMKGQFAIWADSSDPNWYCYFRPYIEITFNLNSGDSWAGSAPDAVAIDGDDAARTVAIPAELPVRDGYKFIGWNSSSTATTAEYAPSANVTLTGNLTLYAIWEKIITVTGEHEVEIDNNITLTASEDGGTWASSDETKATVEDGVVTGKAVGSVTISYSKGTQTINHAVEVTCQMVEIISYAAQDGTKSGQTASGSIGGTADQNLEGTKMGSTGHYIFVTLAKGNFQAGDIVKIVTTTGSQTEKLTVFNSNADDASQQLDIEGVTAAGTYKLKLAADPASNTIGLRRLESNKQNARIESISVLRPNCSKLVKPVVSITGHETPICSGDGSDVTLTANVTKGTADSYQWYANDKPVTGETASTYTITPTGDNASTVYKVEAINSLFTSDKSAGVQATMKPGVISGPNEVMRTQEIVLTANAIGGEWSVTSGATLSAKDETDGLTSKVTLTGTAEGTVTVSYTLDGCENKYTVKVTEYIICNTFDHEETLEYDFADGMEVHYSTEGGKLGTGTTKRFKTKSSMCGESKIVHDNARILIQLPQSATKLILYGCSSTARNYHGSNPVVQVATTISAGTAGNFREFTTRTLDRDVEDNAHTFTITCTGDTYLPKDSFIWVLFDGTTNIHTICYKPVDCSDLIVTPSGSTTLNSGETVTLTASIIDGKFTTTNSDKILLTDNGDGTATVKALSLISAADATVTYTRPNGCEFETPIHINADPCPQPTVVLYTPAEQVLGPNKPLILSGKGNNGGTGTLSYQWYKNGVAIPSATVADFVTTTDAAAGDYTYYLKVTNSAGGSNKSVDSDPIKVTVSADCANRVLITADAIPNTNKAATNAPADGLIGGTMYQSLQDSKKMGNEGAYFILELAEGNFQAGDIIKIQTASYNDKNLNFSYAINESSYLSDSYKIKTNASGYAEYTLTNADISKGVTNTIGLFRSDAFGQNPVINTMWVERPFCFDNKTTCLDDVVNFAVCEAPAAGYSYEWKVVDGGEEVAGTKSSFTITSDTENHQVVCYIKKGGSEQATQSFNITGDGTAFTFSKTRYFRGEKETLTPVTLGGTWSSSDDTKATISSDGVFEVITSSTDDITITYTNANGCSHSETVIVGDPYFVFTNASGDMKWSTVGNWSYATSAPYKPVGTTGILPNLNSRVILLEPCVVDIPNANANFIRIATGTAGEVTGNGKLNILPTGALTVATTVQMFEADGTNFGSGKKVAEGLLTIEASPAGQGALAFVENNNAMLPQATVIQYLKGYYPVDEPDETTWQYIGVPFSDAAPFIYSFYGGWVQQWNESSAQWSYASHETDISTYPEAQPQMFTGYAYTQKDNESGVYYDNRGTLVPTQNTTINLEFTNASRGRNLLANSWTSPIYLNKMDDGDFVNTEKIFYVFGTGSYKTWLENYTENTINPQTVDSEPAPGQYMAIPVFAGSYTGRGTIAPQQGFFIYAKNSGASVTFDYERVVHNISETAKETRPRLSPAAKREQDAVSMTKVTVMSDNGADQAYILTGKETFTNGYEDGWDGKKMEGLSSMPSLSIETPSGRMQISAQPQLLGTTFNFRAGSDDFYELIITTDEQDLMLKDMQENITVALQDTTRYAFFANNKVSSSRFCIVKKPSVVTDIDNEYGSLLNAYLSEDGKIVINNFTGEKQVVNMYDMTGKQLLSIPAVSEITTINAPAQGAYLIKVGKQVFKIIRK